MHGLKIEGPLYIKVVPTYIAYHIRMSIGAFWNEQMDYRHQMLAIVFYK